MLKIGLGSQVLLYWLQIGSISISHFFSHFSVVVCLRWLHNHMLSVSYISREGRVCVLYYCAFLMVCANNRITEYVLTDGPIRLFVEHISPLSSSCMPIWRHELLKWLSFCLERLSKIISQFFQLSFMQYMGLWVFSIHIFSYETCTLSNCHNQFGCMTNLPLIRVI